MDIAAKQLRQDHWLWYLSLMWLAVLMAAAPAARADIYSWEDEHGVIHFSNQDAPSDATLYMREPEPTAATQAPAAAQSAPAAVQQEMQAALERANRKLERALDRVDDLTEEVRESQQDAAVAAALAQQAAEFSIAGATQAARESEREVGRRTVYYASPLISHSLSRHHRLHGKSSHFSHRKFKHLNKFKSHRRHAHHNKFVRPGHRLPRHFRHGGIKTIRQNPSRSGIHRSRISRARGIR